MNKYKVLSIFLLIVGFANGKTTEIIYTPTNPSFGGNPLNGSFLLSKAQSQNDHSEDIEVLSDLERTQETFSRLTLSNVSRIVSDIVSGDTAFDQNLIGTNFELGNGVLITLTNINPDNPSEPACDDCIYLIFEDASGESSFIRLAIQAVQQ